MTFQVDTVFVWVTDLERSIGWYSRLGIEPEARYGGWQPMKLEGETQFALHEGKRATSPSTGAVAFRVADLDAEIERLGSLGIEPSDHETTDTGHDRFTTFQDPDGNDVQLLER